MSKQCETSGSEDDEDLRVAVGLLEAMRRGDVVPHLELTDAKASRFAAGIDRLGEPARIFVSRAAIAAGPAALAGEIAHEYAHFLEPRDRRDARLITRIWVVYWLWMAIVGWIVIRGLSVWPGHAALIAVLWSWPSGPLVFWLTARLSQRRELRADALAVDLLASPVPVLAMLDRIEELHHQASWWVRFVARNSHPNPMHRRKRLTEHQHDAQRLSPPGFAA